MAARSKLHTVGAAGADAESRVRRSLFQLGMVPGWLTVGALLVVSAAGFRPPLTLQLVPFAVSLLFVGLPHGAVDHLAPWRARSETITPARLGVIGALYLLLGTAVLLVWLVAPVVGFVSFILVTWLHWGQGELYPLIALAGVDYLSNEPARWVTVLARGSLPMLVPLVAFPDQYRLVATTLTGAFGSSTLGWASVAFTVSGRAASAVIVGLTCVGTIARGYVRTDDYRPWLLDAGELLLLLAYFSVVPPILAVGCYFCLWHSLRHVVRLIALDETAVDALEAGRPLWACWQFARDAAPLTAAALAFIGGLAAVVPRAPDAPLELVGVYLVAIAAMTVPHVVVVAWLDREQGLWLSSGRPS